MNLSRLFEEVARAHPSETALVSSAGSLSWASLRSHTARLARALRSVGVSRERLVGVCVPRSTASVTAVYGVLRAGGAYVPIDPAHPAERQRFVADDAGLTALVYDSAQTAAPAWADGALVDIAALDGAEELPFDVDDHRDDTLLNVLYTSGSTGRPKGVCGTHDAMLHRLRWQWEALPFTPGETVGHRSALPFVDAGPEMFGGLLRGVRTAVVLPDELADLGRLVAALRAHRVTRLTVVPSLLAALVRASGGLGAALPLLRTWVSSGEALSPALLAAFRASHPAATLVNLYGSTEVTGDVTAAVFPPGVPLPDGDVPIGSALGGATLRVLDARGDAVADGETGELYVSGPLLARGYHRRPNEEAIRFVQRPERAFRTGDLVRRRPDGALSYVGRVDHQVKLRGVRVELEEVERRAAAAFPALTHVAAVVAPGDRLVAFVAPADADVAALRDALARELPDAMLPARLVPVAALPLLPNGKVDRRALASLGRDDARELPPGRLPRTATERAVASLWSTLLRRGDVARDDSFAALGGDSLTLAELMLSLERAFPRARPTLADAREQPLHALARVLDGEAPAPRGLSSPAITLTPLGDEGARDPAVVAMLVEASWDETVRAPTELPARMSEDDARAYCRAAEGVVIRVEAEPAGAGVLYRAPSVGEGVSFPAGSVQLDEWLLARWRGHGVLSDAGAWPLLRAWLAARFDHEVSVVWEDHLAMLAILRARGYTRLGRSFWTSGPDGDGSSGHCEVWLYDLRAWREGRSGAAGD